jgi:hypothetical protein
MAKEKEKRIEMGLKKGGEATTVRARCVPFAHAQTMPDSTRQSRM